MIGRCEVRERAPWREKAIGELLTYSGTTVMNKSMYIIAFPKEYLKHV
jgi:hypothetical protein